MKESTLAYAAGLIDGEGSIMLLATGKYRPKQRRQPGISVTSTSYELLEFMIKWFGGRTRSHKVYAINHKPHWTWRLDGHKALDFLKSILPYIQEKEKKRRAKLLVYEYLKCTVKNGKYPPDMLKKKNDFERTFFSLSRSSTLSSKNGGPGEH